MEKIILIGFMGSGKTTVGKLLAEILSCKFLDTDYEILKLSGSASVSEIFLKEGEASFRNWENQVAKNISKIETFLVVASGGGMIANPANRPFLKTNAKLVYLETNFENIRARVELEIKEKDLTRPLFSDISEAQKLFETRIAIYESNSDLTVCTDNKTPSDIAKEISLKI
jgi:shikimate kinase